MPPVSRAGKTVGDSWWDTSEPEEGEPGVPKRGYVFDGRKRHAQRRVDRRAMTYVGGTAYDLAAAFSVSPVTVRSWYQRGILVPGVGGSTRGALVSVVRLLIRKGVVSLEEVLPPEDLEVVRKAYELEGR